MLPRIALIDNLSAAAYRLTSPAFPAALQFGSPMQTAHWMKQGKCDAALVPVAAIPGLWAQAQPLGDYGIACDGAVKSVLLFTRVPMHEVLARELPVYVSAGSCTSRQLLITLCRISYDSTPIFSMDPARAAARLLIGDEAANTWREEYHWPGIYDLGEWWRHTTGSPFVFARWMMRNGLPEYLQCRLLSWLRQSAATAASCHGREALASQAVSQNLLYGRPDFAMDYYSRIQIALSPAALAGLEHFLELQREEVPCELSA